ncbi:fibronectin type III domain-containing protein [Geomonas sp. RF6]|uniref:fibronectin type III domain-containing protein n=1 Tax=Geomonas sp. RF6 TaxID=2897342 RepID=UPI001E595277|nr:fibronectin type III domain-containing protein [Geomonas sp. RF6]UFS68940.1 fibronectin type III domain-containing protein [Geomonas sp. RF6]
MIDRRTGRRASLAGSRGAVAAAVLIACIAVAAVGIGPATAEAAEAALSWEAPSVNMDGSPISDLAGYRVYIGTSSGKYDESFDAGSRQNYLAYNLVPGTTYYFAVTAYNTSGEESPFSEEVVKSFLGSVETLPPTTFVLQDALLALKYVVGTSPLAPVQLSQYDISPAGADGTPEPDGAVDIGDVVSILRRCVGLR